MKVLVGFVLLIFTLLSCSEKLPSEDLHFFVAGHVMGNSDSINHPFHPAFMKYLEEATADSSLNFGVFTGDIVSRSNVQSWDFVDGAIRKLGKEVYFAPGENDLKNFDLYTARYGNPDYFFEKGNNLFQCWDVSLNGWNISNEQMNKLKKQVENNAYDNVFIFLNHAPWYDSVRTPGIKPNSLKGRSNEQLFYVNSLPKLKNLKTPIYLFAGDVGGTGQGGEISIHQNKNIHLLTTGMGGGEWENILQIHVIKGRVSIDVDYLSEQTSITIDTLYVPLWP